MRDFDAKRGDLLVSENDTEAKDGREEPVTAEAPEGSAGEAEISAEEADYEAAGDEAPEGADEAEEAAADLSEDEVSAEDEAPETEALTEDAEAGEPEDAEAGEAADGEPEIPEDDVLSETKAELDAELAPAAEAEIPEDDVVSETKAELASELEPAAEAESPAEDVAAEAEAELSVEEADYADAEDEEDVPVILPPLPEDIPVAAYTISPGKKKKADPDHEPEPLRKTDFILPKPQYDRVGLTPPKENLAEHLAELKTEVSNAKRKEEAARRSDNLYAQPRSAKKKEVKKKDPLQSPFEIFSQEKLSLYMFVAGSVITLLIILMIIVMLVLSGMK